jgi:hypothetical protein
LGLQRGDRIGWLDAHDAQTHPLACGRKNKGNSVP